jgi:ferritin
MQFIDILTSELRKQTNKLYLFEEISESYKNKMIIIFNKAIKDEMSSGALYGILGYDLIGFKEEEIAEEFINHGREEFDHYYQLLKYASDVGILDSLNIALDPFTQKYPKGNLDNIIKFKQMLENDAMQDYLSAAELAESEGDMLTKNFFLELATDERRHITDILKYSDIGREYIEF